MRATEAVYRGVTRLMEPLAGPALSMLDRSDSIHRGERLGHGVTGPVDTWWHAASLGEVVALDPVLDIAQSRGLAGRFHVTTTSLSGRGRAHRLWPDQVTLAPLDTPGILNRCLDIRCPRSLVFVETELWPNWVRLAHEREISMGLVNGRISDRSWPRYRRWPGLFQPLLSRLEAIAVRYETDAERFLSLGARAPAVRVCGNTKHDRLESNKPASLPWKDALLWTAGSVRPGEEELILDTHHALKERIPGLKLALVPRHPEVLGPRLEQRLNRGSLRAAWKSKPSPRDAEADVLVVDGHGELSGYYAAASVNFVGGTLVDIGGHNVMEAAQAGVPVITGPHLANVREDAEILRRAGGLVSVNDASGLLRTLTTWLTDSGQRDHAARSAARVAEASRGGAVRALEWMVERGVLRLRDDHA